MSELVNFIKNTDDDYLTALSNKGILKRAYKDIETAELIIDDNGQDIIGKFKDVTVNLKLPINESNCSCPSRSICKHIIMTILKIKQANTENVQIVNKEEHNKIISFDSIVNFDNKKLKIILKSKYNKTIKYIKNVKDVEIEETSVIKIKFGGFVVKLVEPIESSSCSCHSKELCEHKATAILLYKLYKKVVTIEELEELCDVSKKTYDMENIHRFAEEIKKTILEEFTTGLSRIPNDISDKMERMAIISHNNNLPDLERDFRSLSMEFKLYFDKMASFKIENLINKLMNIYIKAQKLSNLNIDEAEILEIAGKFKEEYYELNKLNLYGIAIDNIDNVSGYDITVCYFIDKDTKEYYTYSNAIPNFYENKKKVINYISTVWNLPYKLEEIKDFEISLDNPKVSKDNKISSSNKTIASVIGKRKFSKEFLKSKYFEDFGELFKEYFENDNKTNLVFIQAYDFQVNEFDNINQKFQLILYDKNAKHISVEIKYEKGSEYKIKYFEKILSNRKKIGCIFGKIYIQENEVKVYPIGYFKRGDII